MNNLRKRVPFQFVSESTNGQESQDESEILDDQEQEELIQTLADENNAANRQYLLVAQVALILSASLHIIYLLRAEKDSPLFAVFPSEHLDTPIPFATPFTLLALLVHLGLAFLLYPLKHLVISDANIPSFSHPTLFVISGIALVLCILSGRTWQSILWWSITPAISVLVQVIQRWIGQGNASIVELESLKYAAKGA